MWFKRFMRISPICFDVNNGAGGGGSGNGGQGGDGTGGDGGQGSSAGKGEPFAVFPDEQSFMKRINRETQKALSETLKGLGFESADALKALVDKNKADDEAKKTAEQKALEKASAAEQKGKDAINTANARLISAEVKIQAAAAGIPAERVEAAVKLTDISAVMIDDNGNITGAKEAVQACLKANAFLKAGTSGTNIGGGSNPGAGDSDLTPEQAGKQMAEFRNNAGKQSTTGFDPWAANSGAATSQTGVLQQLLDALKGR